MEGHGMWDAQLWQPCVCDERESERPALPRSVTGAGRGERDVGSGSADKHTHPLTRTQGPGVEGNL